ATAPAGCQRSARTAATADERQIASARTRALRSPAILGRSPALSTGPTIATRPAGARPRARRTARRRLPIVHAEAARGWPLAAPGARDRAFPGATRRPPG